MGDKANIYHNKDSNHPNNSCHNNISYGSMGNSVSDSTFGSPV